MSEFRTINDRPIHWNDDQHIHACEGSDVHPGVRLLWTLCQRDVPAGQAYLPGDSSGGITCPRCLAALGDPHP